MRSIIVASIFAFAAHAAELHPHAAEVAYVTFLVGTRRSSYIGKSNGNL